MWNTSVVLDRCGIAINTHSVRLEYKPTTLFRCAECPLKFIPKVGGTNQQLYSVCAECAHEFIPKVGGTDAASFGKCHAIAAVGATSAWEFVICHVIGSIERPASINRRFFVSNVLTASHCHFLVMHCTSVCVHACFAVLRLYF